MDDPITKRENSGTHPNDEENIFVLFILKKLLTKNNLGLFDTVAMFLFCLFSFFFLWSGSTLNNIKI